MALASSEGIYTNFSRLLSRKKILVILFLVIGIFLFVLSLAVGSYEISFKEIVTFSMSPKEKVVIYNIRLPRTVASLVVGTSLALAGLTLQAILRNPLASPSTIGISQGASFGAAIFVVIFKLKTLSIAYFALVGSMIAGVTILLLGRIRSLSSESIVLAGVALSSLFSAATVFIQYIATERELATIVFWTFGDVSRSNWKEIVFTALSASICGIFLILKYWDFMAIESGEESALGIGVSVERLRWQGIILASLASAVATAFHGVIAFVGLIAPHMARRIVGSNYLLLITLSGILGALLLLGADILGRVIVGSGGLPVGVITSFMGAPLFLYLLLRGRK